ncbi:MAG TPA: bifunctional UDP-4-keto-pentose/UDP-xylose synthase [Synergistaceae bacterium]|nr:bifunctional UDP-4-keto-pentose/UDP-xylose synthase [Synergistaceae bacterium]HPJ26140.1 bifunctional UDP-4-keto-pentose/UDP-xylose synthase [Synergistaceae bacterium]HPQ36736.1 bifunctional UDP-4-keto-pentose/UDP-xylose synthase [Synergistaceae bacterium]
MNIFILGTNGFIGYHLLSAILRETSWEVRGFDIQEGNIKNMVSPRFAFYQGDIFHEDSLLEEQIAWADVVIPLAGIARPALYITNPLLVYELDYEQNLKIVRMCVEHDKRVIFPSTSEVYGMTEGVLHEDRTPLTVGPIANTRWIYSCAKQMMDRVIAAYGMQHGLRYTCFRPFNWLGKGLDTFEDASHNQARSVTQFLHNILEGKPIRLVNGGHQRRSFTHIDDGIRGLLAIIRNENRAAEGQIFNLGNPKNNASIRELAEAVRNAVCEHPKYAEKGEKATIEVVEAEAYYGKGYEDVPDRIPSIEKARELLNWAPKMGFAETIRTVVADYLEE